MWYVPAIVIPGKVAFIKEDMAIAMAQKNRTVVYGDDKETIVHDFRDSEASTGSRISYR